MPIKTSNDLNYLGQDETSPGGMAVMYLADTLLKVQASSKLEEDKDFGIKGFNVIATLIKSRSNEAGRKFEMVYSQSEGFHNFFTNFNYLKSLKTYLKGNGKAYYFEFAPDKKFTQKNVYELYKSDEEWAQQFDELMDILYYDFITSKGYTEDEEYLEEESEYSLYGTYKNKDVFIHNEDQTLVWEDGSDFDGVVGRIKVYDPNISIL